MRPSPNFNSRVHPGYQAAADSVRITTPASSDDMHRGHLVPGFTYAFLPPRTTVASTVCVQIGQNAQPLSSLFAGMLTIFSIASPCSP